MVTYDRSARHRSARREYLVAAILSVSVTILAVAPDALAQRKGGGGGGMGGGGGATSSGNTGDPVAFYFPGFDTNGDGKLDHAEWKRRGNFDLLDVNKDGYIDRKEFAALYDSLGKGRKLTRPEMKAAVVIDPDVKKDLVPIDEIGRQSFCIVSRRDKCPGGGRIAVQFGLMETGLGPVFPREANCPGIDETFAEAYQDKTGKDNHGGIDIPVEFNTPILAVADGSVVAIVTNEYQARGIAITLRHSPEESGMPMWTYTEYAHLNAAPTLVIGQRVKKGDVVGLTGNTGVKPDAPSTRTPRRPAIHFAVYYAQSSRFAVEGDYAVPEKPHWMDPVALYRPHGPYQSQQMLELPDVEKDVAVPVMMVDGTFSSPASKRIWPYACRPMGK